MNNISVEKLYDAVIIGGGPAGLTAALYLARARYRVLVLEKERFGGQITITSEVVNYPGVERTSGEELTEVMRKQAQSFGAEFLLTEAQGLELDGDIKTVKTTAGNINCFAVLIAAGAHPRMVGFKGEQEFKGHGVAYCATCDGEFFTGKEVFVVGGGFAAAEESVFLTKYASHVTVLIKGEDFTCAKATADKARNHEKISIVTNAEVLSVEGGDAIEKIVYRDINDGKVTEYSPKESGGMGVFVFAGYEPASELVKDIAQLDEFGYIVTDKRQMTSADGLFAAGDVCIKNLRQVVTAVGDGALAATEIEKYAAEKQEKTGLHPVQPVTRIKKSENHNTENGVFSKEIAQQLSGVFEKMERKLTLKVYKDESPVSDRLEEYIKSMAELTSMIETEIIGDYEDKTQLPMVKIFDDSGKYTGLAFHGVPGGHEFTSFVLGLYNVSSQGQPIDDELRRRIAGIQDKKDIKILVSLSCTMCPELVTSAQRIASLNRNVTAEVFDINHFAGLKEKYKIMSVPCFIINDGSANFGKKNIGQLLDIIDKS